MDGYQSQSEPWIQGLYSQLFPGQSKNSANEVNSSDNKRKQRDYDTIPSGKRRKTEQGTQDQLISYATHSIDIPLSGNALLDHIIDTATLLAPDQELEVLKSYWLVSPVELRIISDPPIELIMAVQRKDYYLYLVASKTENETEVYDRLTKNFLIRITWRIPGEYQTHPLSAFLSSYQRVQNAFGSSDSGLNPRQEMWNRFTKTDEYKQLNSDGYNYSNSNNRNNNQPPETLKTTLPNDEVPLFQQLFGKKSNADNQGGLDSSSPSGTSVQYDSYPEYTTDEIFVQKKEQPAEKGKEYHIPFSEIKIGDEIGEGGYGVIYYAEINGKRHAIKRFKYYEARKEDALKEAEALMTLRHKRIVSLIGITKDPKTEEIMLVMEYMENGSLEDLLMRDKIKLSREDIIQMGLDIAKGLHFLHAQRIIHRDLKSANVLLYNNKKRAKLSDFGTVKIFGKSSKANTMIGTMCFMAPEMLHEDEYKYPADVYSFGVLLYNMLTLKVPPIIFRDSAQASAKIKEEVKDVKFQELIIKCCKKEPEERPSIDECIAWLVQMQYEIKPFSRPEPHSSGRLKITIILLLRYDYSTVNNFTQETVDKVLTDALNLPKGADKKSFVQLGGDSLSAVKFVNLLNNTLSIKVRIWQSRNKNLRDMPKSEFNAYRRSMILNACIGYTYQGGLSIGNDGTMFIASAAYDSTYPLMASIGCPIGQHLAQDGTQCGFCNAGYSYNKDSSKCEKCPADQFSDDADDTCTPCSIDPNNAQCIKTPIAR